MNRPYDFVHFLKCLKYNQKGNKEGIIPIKVNTLTPIHIYSGRLNTKDNETFYKEFMKINNKIIIPGTSLKGCIRTIAESISYSCLSHIGKHNRSKLPDKGHDKKEKCIICDMFGSMGNKSKVQFSDLRFVLGKTNIIPLPDSYPPNPENYYYISKNGKYKGYKFYKHGVIGVQKQGSILHEFVMEDAEFEGEVVFSNLTEEQVQLLCFSLGLTGDIQPKIGYGKSYYYGSISITSDEKWVKEAEKYKNTKRQDIRANIDKLMEILSYNNAVKTVY